MDQLQAIKDNINNEGMLTAIPDNVSLANIPLPNKWDLYLYDKQLFKKMTSRPNFQAKPHKKLCTISTINDLICILQLMGVKTEQKNKIGLLPSDKINLDMNDYIIMRDGIEPIWEDPKNSNGGTFTIKMPHSKGYDVWSTFVMFMLGETLTYDMSSINGITVSYISDANSFHNPISTGNNSYTYIKIWDGKSNRTRDQFVNILPLDLLEQIKNESLMYSQNNKKPQYDKNIITKLSNGNKQNSSYNRRERGGFYNSNNRNRR